MTDPNSTINRRTYLKGTVTAAALAATAGCSSNSNSEGDATTSGDSSADSDGDETQAPESDSAPLEIQHWWTGGDGNAAITALLEGFGEAYPEVDIKQNPVSGGAGQNLHTVIKKRVLNKDPPSTWQAWPGANLTPYTDAGALNDIGESVWDHNGMKDAYLAGPKDAAKPADKFVTVPINIHRLNNLFYNVEVVEDVGVDPSSVGSPSELVDVLKQVTDAGYVGMAQQTKSAWSTEQLWAQVLLGEHGVDTYMNAIDGSPDKDAIQDALEITISYKEYFNNDASSLSWTEANKKVINGDAAFFHQGDWAAGMYRGAEGFEFGDHWDQVAYPGTDGVYALNMDSFPFPANNPSPETTTKFLRYCGTADAQSRFNPKKGSIPPRTDVSKDNFGPFLSRQMDDFANSNAQPPSITHGLAVGPDMKTKVDEAFGNFISSWDAATTADELASALSQ